MGNCLPLPRPPPTIQSEISGNITNCCDDDNCPSTCCVIIVRKTDRRYTRSVSDLSRLGHEKMS